MGNVFKNAEKAAGGLVNDAGDIFKKGKDMLGDAGEAAKGLATTFVEDTKAFGNKVIDEVINGRAGNILLPEVKEQLHGYNDDLRRLNPGVEDEAIGIMNDISAIAAQSFMANNPNQDQEACKIAVAAAITAAAAAATSGASTAAQVAAAGLSAGGGIPVAGIVCRRMFPDKDEE